MIWGAITHRGRGTIALIDEKLNSEGYCKI